jgi:predicted XRE-type DNA-binding protein
VVSRPRVSDVVNKKTAKFTFDTLVEMLSRVGKPGKSDFTTMQTDAIALVKSP